MLFFLSGFFNWLIQRISAITLIVFLILNLNGFSIYATNLLFFLILIHSKFGIEAIFDDYMHNLFFKIIGLISFRLVIIYILKFLFLLAL